MPRQNVKFGLRQVKSSADAEREVSFSNSKNTCEANFTAKLLHAHRALHCADMAHSLPLVDCPVDSRATVTTESVTMPEQFDRQLCDGTVPVLPVCRDSFIPLELSNPTLLPRPNAKEITHTLPICSTDAAECFRCPVRDGRSCFAIRSVVIVTALANAPGRWCEI